MLLYSVKTALQSCVSIESPSRGTSTNSNNSAHIPKYKNNKDCTETSPDQIRHERILTYDELIILELLAGP